MHSEGELGGGFVNTLWYNAHASFTSLTFWHATDHDVSCAVPMMDEHGLIHNLRFDRLKCMKG